MAEEGLVSPQRKAKQLLYMADAVQRSIKSRRNIVNGMKKQSEAVVDDFENSTAQTDTSDMSLNSQESPSITSNMQEAATAVATQRPSRTMPNKTKSERKSKTKKIAELRQQLQDCESALVEIKENASLKYLKLQMEHDELKETCTKLKELKAQADEENLALQRKLTSAVGAHNVEWIAELESNQTKLQTQVDEIKAERDATKEETEDLKKLCCSSCLQKTSPTPRAQAAPRTRSLWSLFQLDEEARATETEAGASTVASTICASAAINTLAVQNLSPPGKIAFPSSRTDDTEKADAVRITSTCHEEPPPSSTISTSDDLEADLEAIEQQMKNEIDAMSREWKRPNKKRSHNRIVRRDLLTRNKSNSQGKITSSARCMLDSFFSQSIRDLGSEEMDEEESFYSLQKSVSSLSRKDAEMKRPSDERGHSDPSPRTPDSGSTASLSPDSAAFSPTSKSRANRVLDCDASGVPVDDIRVQDHYSRPNMTEESHGSISPSRPAAVDRRGVLSKAAFSFGDSFRSLSEEVEDETFSSNAFDRKLENLRAKSLRSDFAATKRKTQPARSTLRSSTSVVDHKAVHWVDPSYEDHTKVRLRKEVEAWAAIDLAPITPLSV